MNEKVLEGAREMIAGFLKNRRNELGITQAQLADMTGMGIATIKRMEDAKFWPGLKQFLILTHHLDCFFFIEENDGESDTAKLMRDRWKRKGDSN